MSTLAPNPAMIKAALTAVWTTGDFGQIAQYDTAPGEAFVQHLALASGERVLDVACGTGNFSLPAARAGAQVTGLDIAPNLLAQARARAEAAGLAIQFDEGDAEALPYADGAFATVVSIFGAMFAPRPDRVAAELLRVCQPGGRIAMLNWTPASFTAQLAGLVARIQSPPPHMTPPVLWGVEATVRERLHDGIKDLHQVRRPYTLAFPFGPGAAADMYIRYLGAVQRPYAALDAQRQPDFRRDLERLIAENNRAGDGTTRLETECLEVLAIRA
ncbi:MAG: class I SAM-dependent methyltransferase [Thermomicrobiales bacterium]